MFFGCFRQIYTSTSFQQSCNSSSKYKIRPYFKNMSLSQWKLITQLRDFLTKSQSETVGNMYPLSKEWISFLQKFPRLTGIMQTLPSARNKHHNSKDPPSEESATQSKESVRETVKSNYVSSPDTIRTQIAPVKNVEPIQDYAYGVIRGIQEKLYLKTPQERQTVVPKWKTKNTSVISKVGAMCRYLYFLINVIFLNM